MDFENVINDLNRQLRRAKSATHLEAAKELSNNVYPLLIAVVEAFDERLAETEEQLSAFIVGSESVVQPELAAQVLGVFELSEQLCQAVEKGEPTEVIIEALRKARDLALESLEAATVEPGEGEEAEDGEDEGAVEEAVEAPADEASESQENA